MYVNRRFDHAVMLTTLVSVLSCAIAPPSLGQDRQLPQPPAASLVRAGQQDQPTNPTAFSGPVPRRTIGAEVFYELGIQMMGGTLFNPTTGEDDQVLLRSYTGQTTGAAPAFAAPTVDIWPGETFRLTLNNQLPADHPSCPGGGGINSPHCFNSTNMHTHGLWVSPSGNSDNVLLSINPGVAFQYEYNIPADHPAGTFWYHSHRHGSTALQVSSGMAGALIIHGDRIPARQPDGSWAPGDIDVLLTDAEGTPLQERILLFQQIAYACRDTAGAIKVNPDGSWRCDDGDVGTVEGYDQLNPASWSDSGRFTSINGVVLPTISGAMAGVPERWRLIHGGVRATINVKIRKAAMSIAPEHLRIISGA